MGSNLVIVAIPDEDDRVWKVSSEQVPHLTLLYLGDSDQVTNVDKIVEFVEHAATTTLKRFYLPVDRRDTLGADEADVLFFKKGRYDFKAIRDFRAALLQDNNIRTAYDSASQFEGPWEPHLTLGYPATPANPMPDGWEGRFYSVEFTKIAVWVDNFDGPEFLLSDYWDDEEALAMGVMSPNQARIAMGAEALQHFGVKGMKWGVRKQSVTSGAKTAAKTVGTTASKGAKATVKGAKRAATAIGDTSFEAAVDSGHARTRVLTQGGKNYKKEDLPALNAKPEYQKARRSTYRLTHPRDSVTKAYRKEAMDAYLNQLEKTANSMQNTSKTRQYTIRERGDDLPAEGGKINKYFWDVSTRKVVHVADNHDDTTTVEVILDKDGFIVDLKPVLTEAESMSQSAITSEEFVEALMHFGIKGMKWGQRKARPAPTASAPTAVSRVPHGDKRKTKIEVEGGQNHPAHEDAIKVAEARAKLQKSGVHALSNKELRDVRERVQLEEQVQSLMTSRGRKFVRNHIQNESQNLARAGARAGVKKGLSKAGPHVVRKAAVVGATAALI